MRRYRITDSRAGSTGEHSLLDLTKTLELGNMELDEVVDLEVGEAMPLDSHINVERIE